MKRGVGAIPNWCFGDPYRSPSRTLELIDGFRGMVLGATVQIVDSREEVFRLVARDHLLKGRNHHRALKRELRRARALVAALGEDRVDARLRALLGED